MSKQFRTNQIDKEPQFQCDNCKCKRFSKCGCEKKEEKESK